MSFAFFGGGGAEPFIAANAEAGGASDVVGRWSKLGDGSLEGVAEPASVKEPVVLRVGLVSRLVPTLTGGVGNDSVALSSTAASFSRKSAGTVKGALSSCVSGSSKLVWSLLRERGEPWSDIVNALSLMTTKPNVV